MKKEHLLAVIAACFLLAYLLDAVVNPLALNLATPYQFFYPPQQLLTYAFSTTSILLKAVGLLFSALLILNFLGLSPTVKGITLLILSTLLQLYAVQDIATGSFVVPLEWSLGFTLAGILFLIPTVIFFIVGSLTKVHKTIIKDIDLPDEPRQLHPLD